MTKKLVVMGSGNGSNFEAIVEYFKNPSNGFRLKDFEEPADSDKSPKTPCYPELTAKSVETELKRDFMSLPGVSGSPTESVNNSPNQQLLEEIEITCVSDVKDAYIFERAQRLRIKNLYLPFEKNEEFFKENKFDLGVLAGYMRILNKETLELCKFINIHPSLLPAFAGKNAIERAFKAGVKVSGVTVHHVIEAVDKGKIIAQYPVFIDLTTDLEEFEQEIHKVEHKLYPFVVESVLKDVVFSFDMLLKPKDCSGGGCGGCGGCGK